MVPPDHRHLISLLISALNVFLVCFFLTPSLYAMDKAQKATLSIKVQLLRGDKDLQLPLLKLSGIPQENLFPRLTSQLDYREKVLKRALLDSFVAKEIGTDFSKLAKLACSLNVSIDDLWCGLLCSDATTCSLSRTKLTTNLIKERSQKYREKNAAQKVLYRKKRDLSNK